VYYFYFSKQILNYVVVDNSSEIEIATYRIQSSKHFV